MAGAAADDSAAAAAAELLVLSRVQSLPFVETRAVLPPTTMKISLPKATFCRVPLTLMGGFLQVCPSEEVIRAPL